MHISHKDTFLARTVRRQKITCFVFLCARVEHVVDLRYSINGQQAQGWFMRWSAQEQNVTMSLDPTRVYRPDELIPRNNGGRGRPPANAEKIRVLEVETR